LSLGVIVFDLGRSQQPGIAQTADEALYAAKARGRNQVASWERDSSEVEATMAAH